MIKRPLSLLSDQRGSTAIEYALIASIILIAIVFAIEPIGDHLGAVFQGAADAMDEGQ